MSSYRSASLAALAGLVLILPPAASAQNDATEWVPYFENEAVVGALDRRSIRRQETHSFPVNSDVRRIRAAIVPKDGAPYGNARYGYIVASADVACDLNEIMWVREEYFHFDKNEPGDVLRPAGAERKRPERDSIDQTIAVAACADDLLTGDAIASAGRFAILAKASLVGSNSPPRRNGWTVVDTAPDRVIALDLGSITPAMGQYGGGDLIQARTVIVERGGSLHEGVAHDYLMETHLIRCRAGATATAYSNYYAFDQPDTPAEARRTIGPRLNPVTPGSTGMQALLIACGLVQPTTQATELQALLPTLSGMVGRWR